MKLKSFTCPNCTASLTPVEGKHYMFCQYCGSKIAMDEIEFYREDARTVREKIRANKEEHIHLESEKTKRKANSQKTEIINNIICVVFFVLAAIFFFLCVVLK